MPLEDAIKSFAWGMREASELISDLDPDHLIAPMMGSVPFVDAMYVADPNFNPNIVEYMPASSHVPNINNIIKDWITNFLESNVDLESPSKLITIDEVVSGGSATRVNRAIEKAAKNRQKELQRTLTKDFWTTEQEKFEEVASYLDKLTDFKYHELLTEVVKNKQEGLYNKDKDLLNKHSGQIKEIIGQYLSNHIEHTGIGIQDSKNGRYEQENRNKSYEQMVNEGKIIPINVQTILTMDDSTYCPVRYKKLEGKDKDYLKFSPVVDPEPKITSDYMELLDKIARTTESGRNPHPVSISRVIHSSDYLGIEFGGNYKK